MGWFDSILDKAKEQINGVLTGASSVAAAKDFIAESFAQRIRDEACAKAYALLAQSHRGVTITIIWQNALLITLLLPVYFLHSPLPFYGAYAAVICYSLFMVIKAWPVVIRLVKTLSVTQTLSGEILLAINNELTQRQFYERKAVEWLGADLKKIADEVAHKLRPDVIAAVSNMAVILGLAFIAFRLFAIPMLEQRALH